MGCTWSRMGKKPFYRPSFWRTWKLG